MSGYRLDPLLTQIPSAQHLPSCCDQPRRSVALQNSITPTLTLPTPCQAMAAYEPFILGMLANFDSLPQDRIHNMLKV